MKTIRSVALVGILLSACGQGGVPKDGVPTLSPGVNTLDVSRTVTVKVPEGQWTLTNLPSWLQATPLNQHGFTYVTFTPQAHLGIPADAQQAQLRASVLLRSARGDYIVSATYPLTALRGVVTTSDAATLPEPSAQSLHEGIHQPGRVVIQWRGTPDHAPAGRLVQQQVFSDGVHTEVRAVPDVAAALTALRRTPGVVRAFPSSRMHAAQAQSPWNPGDALAGYQWVMPRIGFGAVLSDRTAQYPRQVTVAVLDTGVRRDHPDLRGQLQATGAIDLISAADNGDGDGVDTDPTDPGVPGGGSHGTAVTGLIAAKHDAQGIVGAVIDAPVQVQPIRVLGTSSDGDTAEIMLALRYAAGEPIEVNGQMLVNPNPAQVINLSLGASGSAFDDAQKAFICEAVAAATARGALVVAAAGNTGVADAQYPAACPDAVAVAAVTLDRQGRWAHAPYSATGSHVTLSAPGGALETTFNGAVVNGTPMPDGLLTTTWRTGAASGSYDLQQGTSFATPLVSGVAALMFSKGVVSTPAQAKARLIATATDVLTSGRDNESGAGVLNAAAALGLSADATPLPTFRVTITSQNGTSQWQPPVKADGSWTAYLSGGTYVIRAGVDRNANGRLDETEVTQKREVTLRDGEAQAAS